VSLLGWQQIVARGARRCGKKNRLSSFASLRMTGFCIRRTFSAEG